MKNKFHNKLKKLISQICNKNYIIHFWSFSYPLNFQLELRSMNITQEFCLSRTIPQTLCVHFCFFTCPFSLQGRCEQLQKIVIRYVTKKINARLNVMCITLTVSENRIYFLHEESLANVVWICLSSANIKPLWIHSKFYVII